MNALWINISTKIIVFLLGKRYTVLNVVAMLLMCVGLVLFNLADASVQTKMDETGEYSL